MGKYDDYASYIILRKPVYPRAGDVYANLRFYIPKKVGTGFIAVPENEGVFFKNCTIAVEKGARITNVDGRGIAPKLPEGWMRWAFAHCDTEYRMGEWVIDEVGDD